MNDPENGKLREQMQAVEQAARSPRVHDPINPTHYHSTGLEPIVAIESWNLGFNLGNTVKYVARAELKGDPITDLKKARYYLDREIKNRESKSQPS